VQLYPQAQTHQFQQQNLYRATALVLETIHAYMLGVVDDYNTYPTNAPFTNFPE
jgi:hypothetical protein